MTCVTSAPGGMGKSPADMAALAWVAGRDESCTAGFVAAHGSSRRNRTTAWRTQARGRRYVTPIRACASPSRLSADLLMKMVRQEIPEREVNELVWSLLGYRRNDDGTWDTTNVVAEWTEAHGHTPPDFLGSPTNYAPEVDRPVKLAVQRLTRNVPEVRPSSVPRLTGHVSSRAHPLTWISVGGPQTTQGPTRLPRLQDFRAHTKPHAPRNDRELDTAYCKSQKHSGGHRVSPEEAVVIKRGWSIGLTCKRVDDEALRMVATTSQKRPVVDDDFRASGSNQRVSIMASKSRGKEKKEREQEKEKKRKEKRKT